MQTLLDSKMVLGEPDVAGSAENVKPLGVAWIKVLMALKGAGPGKPIKAPLGVRFIVRYQPIDIGEVGMFLRIFQVRDQEPDPSVPRFRVGNEKCRERRRAYVPACVIRKRA